jgi:RHS repeat-associated protein
VPSAIGQSIRDAARSADITTGYNADGEITSTGDNFSHYAYTYTGQGEVASVDNAGTPGVPDVLLNSGYDTSGNRSSLSATIGGVKDFLTNYSYDTLSRLDEIDQQGQSGGNAVAMKSLYFGLNAIGDITQIDRANSVFAGPQQNGPAYSVLSYAATTGLLTGINHEYMGASIDNLSYTYDSLARVSTFGSIDGTATYGYDATSQVVSAAYTTASGGHQPANESRSYDPNGNQTTAGFMVGADNHLTSDGTFNFTFDPAGNLSTRIRISNAGAADYKTVYDWDYRNRLTDVEFFNNSGTLTQHVHYAYDVFDHLIERDLDQTGGGTYTQMVHYVWDGDNIVLAFDGHQQLIARYLNGPNTSAYDQYFTTLAEEDVTSPSSQGVVSYPLLDQQATVRDDVDANGNLLYHAVFASYGATTYESNTTVPHLTGWQGGYVDPVTGQDLSGERWQNMADAVWDSEDPIGFLAGDTNLSRSRSNDPTNLTDPSGEFVPPLVAGAIAFAWWLFTPKVAGAPSNPDDVARIGGLTRRQNDDNAVTTVELCTVPFAAGGIYGPVMRRVGGGVLGHLAGGFAASSAHKLGNDALSECYAPGRGLSTYNPFTPLDYVANGLTWAGMGMAGEVLVRVGGKILRVRFSGPDATPEILGEVPPADLPPNAPIIDVGPPEGRGPGIPFDPSKAVVGQPMNGIDPASLEAGRSGLVQGRLEVQRKLICDGTVRNTPIRVTKDGVIYDGNHGARAALEAGMPVDVHVIGEPAVGKGPVRDLPVKER